MDRRLYILSGTRLAIKPELVGFGIILIYPPLIPHCTSVIMLFESLALRPLVKQPHPTAYFKAIVASIFFNFTAPKEGKQFVIPFSSFKQQGWGEKVEFTGMDVKI